MAGVEKDTVDRIITQLDEGGCLFPRFRLSRVNNRPVLLGRGGFSSVYEMEDRIRPNRKFALKVIGFENHTISSAEFWKTVKIQRTLCRKSEYIVKIFGAGELFVKTDARGSVIKVSDTGKKYCEEGNTGNELLLRFVLMEKLDRIIIRDSDRNASLLRNQLNGEVEVQKFVREIGQALKAVHGCGVFHRDIKLENVFWDANEKVYKLGDFGLAKYAAEDGTGPMAYTEGYGAPEISRRLCKYYHAAADIYSVGVSAFLLLNDFKFPGSDRYYPKPEVQYNPYFVFPAPKNASEKMAEVIRKMCSCREEDRYQCMEDVLTDLRRKVETEKKESNEEMNDMETESYSCLKLKKKRGSVCDKIQHQR